MLLLTLHRINTEIACINDFINDINNEILYLPIPVT